MLARLRKSTQENEGGFTLIELLVVMIIIGILAAIAIPAFLNQKKKAKETAAKSDATNISKEIGAALVDGPIGSLTISAPSGGKSTLTWSDANGTGQTATVSVSTDMTPSVQGPATVTYAASTASDQYCVVVTPNTSTGASIWKSGPTGGLTKGAPSSTTVGC